MTHLQCVLRRGLENPHKSSLKLEFIGRRRNCHGRGGRQREVEFGQEQVRDDTRGAYPST
jgi:hypothetical protein